MKSIKYFFSILLLIAVFSLSSYAENGSYLHRDTKEGFSIVFPFPYQSRLGDMSKGIRQNSYTTGREVDSNSYAVLSMEIEDLKSGKINDKKVLSLITAQLNENNPQAEQKDFKFNNTNVREIILPLTTGKGMGKYDNQFKWSRRQIYIKEDHAFQLHTYAVDKANLYSEQSEAFFGSFRILK